MALPKRQAVVSSLFLFIAIFLVSSLPLILCVLDGNLFHETTWIIVTSVLLGNALSSGLLGMPLLLDNGSNSRSVRGTSVYLNRAAAMSCSVTAISIVIVGAVSEDKHRYWPLLLGGTGILTSASISLMATFWPNRKYSTPAMLNSLDPTRQDAGVSTQQSEESQVAGDEECADAIATSDYHLMEENSHLQDTVQEESQPLIQPTDTEESPQQLDGQVEPSSRLRGTRRLLQLAAPQVFYLYAGCIVLLIRLPFSLAIPHFVSTTLAALAHGHIAAARREILLLFSLGTIDAALDFWCVFLFGYANQRIVRSVRLDLFAQILKQEIAFFDEHSSGELASRLNSDCSEMAGDLTWFFRFSIESVVRITGITAYMLIRSPILGACALTIVPIVAVINKLYGNWLRKNAMAVQDALADANAVAQEALANVRTVIAFAAESKEYGRYQGKVQDYYILNIRQLFMTGIYYMAVSTFLINTIVQGTLLWIGATLIQNGNLSADVLLAFMLYQGQLQSETMNLFQSYSSLIKSSGAGDKVFCLMDRQIPEPGTGARSMDQTRDDDENSSNNRGMVSTDDARESDGEDASSCQVEFSNVTFAYPTRPDSIVLNNFSLTVPAGKTVALVGASGCGKTTIVNLLQRFYDPSAGAISVNGVNLRHKNSVWLQAYRRNVLGIVTQDPVLFRGSILENIVYGCHDTEIDTTQAMAAATLSHASEFIHRFPNRYDTAVGERGTQLSGGQKQRIAIARALVKKPRLLLLDEATSALDAASERAVQQALDTLLSSRDHKMTTIVIAHRLRTVQSADYIGVMHQGAIVEWGNHAELLQQRGEYWKMVERAGSDGVFSTESR